VAGGEAARGQRHRHGAQQRGEQRHQVEEFLRPLQRLPHLGPAALQRLDAHAAHVGALGLRLGPLGEARTGPSSPATAKRQVMRLAGCTSLVAGRSAALTSTRGAKLRSRCRDPAPADDAADAQPGVAQQQRIAGRFRPSASSSGLSTQASPRAGMSRVVAPGLGLAATVRLPRSG
jgi:hypothetical protein